MKYIRTKDGRIIKVREGFEGKEWKTSDEYFYKHYHSRADTIEELCDCFVKIKRKGNCKPYVLKFDYKDLPTLKEQAIKYKDSIVYGAIHIEDEGLIYVAKMNESGVLELL